MSTIEHIPFATLIDLVEGRSAPDERERAHIAACQACAADVVWINRVIELMRADRYQAAPPDLVARAKQLFRTPIAEQSPRMRRRVVAELSFDSARMPPAFGIRAGAPAKRQLLFTAEAFSINLLVAPSDTRWAVSGQLLGDQNGLSADLRGAEAMARATLNDLGEFILPPLPAGQYTLTLQLSDFDIEIPNLELGPYTKPRSRIEDSP